MEPLHPSPQSTTPIRDEMIPSISLPSSPTLHRKHLKERGLNGSPYNMSDTREEAKVHSSRIKRSRSSRRAGILLHCFIVVAVFSWFGLQMYMTGNLVEEKPSFLPLVDIKKTSFVSNFNDLIANLFAWLPFTNSHDSTETNQSKLKQQQMEDDYIFIFYALLCINALAMLLSILRRYIKTRNADAYRNSIQSELEMTQHYNTQHLKDDEEYLQHEQLEEKKRQIHHKLFYQTYLPPYLLATSADWLQGPYKYALYSSYGYTQRDIAHLFVVGYGSGMVLGSVVGGLADGYGRKRLCLCYCIAYAISVTCTHSKDYYILLLGRCGGGVGTSLLFSVFESWLIGAHTDRGLVGKHEGDGGEKWLAESFAVGTYGSSLVAIASGILANFIVSRSGKMRPFNLGGKDADTSLYYGGYIAAFDACWPILICCAAMIMLMWEENYGEDHSVNDVSRKPAAAPQNESVPYKRNDEDENFSSLQEVESQSNGNSETSDGARHKHHADGVFATLGNGMVTVWRSPPILMCCIIGSFFEGAMYIFIFLWTPALTSIQRTIKLRDLDGSNENAQELLSTDSHGDVDELPFGWIFSSFMVCCMLGTMAFSYLTNIGVSASKSLIWILALSAISCLAMAVPFTLQINSSSGAQSWQYAGMLLYEFCIGAYYPASMTVKGTIVPEDQRAAIYNVFRLPLNLMVLLYLVGDFNTETSFLANAVMLMIACGLQIKLRSVGSAGSPMLPGFTLVLTRKNLAEGLISIWSNRG
ncbi:hypothetical protein ACHAXN_003524 [Cyclotella atomus]